MIYTSTHLKIGLESNLSDGTAKIYVTCKAQNTYDARDVVALFNRTVGGFEAYCLENTPIVRVFCQLHRADDVDATEGDRGNTVADAFIRIVHIARKVFPQSVVLPSAFQCIHELPFTTDDPHLLRIEELKAYLSPDQSQAVLDVDERLTAHLREFELSDLEQGLLLEGAYIPITQAIEQDERKLPVLGILDAIDEEYFDVVETESESELVEEDEDLELEEDKPKLSGLFFRIFDFLQKIWGWLKNLVK